MIMRKLFKMIGAILIAAAVALISQYAVWPIDLPDESFVPLSFVTHTVMLLLSLILMWVFSKGHLERYGLTRGTYKFSPAILLWVLPTAVLTGMAAFASPVDAGNVNFSGLAGLQHVIFVWIYASIAEELLTRGLLQTMLNIGERSDALTGKFSMPVILSALFFGAMHLVLLKSMGPAAVPVIVLAVLLGLGAGRYRQATGSVVPAIIVHMLFNIGGTMPLWVIQWLQS